MAKDTILVICAHNDDNVIGAGGTLAKFAMKGFKVKTVIFSFGEKSHPHFKEEVIVKKRIEESLHANKILGGKGIAYLGLKEGNFDEDIKAKRVKQKLRELFAKEKPITAFTHAVDDAHKDHRTVYNLVKDLCDEKAVKCPAYSFEVWHLVNLKKRQLPKMIVDITKTFKKKVKAFKAHESQKLAMASLLWSIYFKASVNGFLNKCKYAEVFYKIN